MIRYQNGAEVEIIAEAHWQDLNETLQGNPRKRTPEWVINLSYSCVGGGSSNVRLTAEQARALVNVLTKAILNPTKVSELHTESKESAK